MKKLLTVFLLTAMAVSCLGLVGCANRPPEVSEIYDRVVELVEASYEVNTVFYGEGLPYYDRELPVYAYLYADYTAEAYTKDYHIVSNHAKFHSTDAIKLAAEAIYSPQLLEGAVYPAAFDGLMVNTPTGGAKYAAARYQDGNEDFYISAAESEDPAPTPLVYDYATMKIIRPSNAEHVLLSLTAWEEDKPNTPFTARLSLSLVDGIWLLDKLTV